MTKILDFFKREPAPKRPGRSPNEIIAEVKRHAAPALLVNKTNGIAQSYFGGDPFLPGDVEWPSKDGHNLTFLASIDLAEVASAGVIPWLPDLGRLLFFYDADNQPWGFDPADRGGWSVLHVGRTGTAESAPTDVLPRVSVEFEKTDSLPDWQRFDALGIVLEAGELDSYEDAYLDWLGERSGHQIGGYPRPVQNDTMELESQLASNGLYCGDASGYESDEGRRLADGAHDWRLLLQFDTDDDLDVMWGDVGTLYFWVREQDARKGDFSNVWVVLQCC